MNKTKTNVVSASDRLRSQIASSSPQSHEDTVSTTTTASSASILTRKASNSVRAAIPSSTPEIEARSTPELQLPMFKNIYSSSGFDFLGALFKVATRKNPEINLGKVDESCAFVVCDNTQNDCPIIYVSETFERLTGYNKHEVLGRNSRFLQSPDGNVQAGIRREFVDNDAVFYLKNRIATKREAQRSLINYRKGGQPFMNLLTIIPITGEDNTEIKYFIGFLVDLVETPTSVQREAHSSFYTVNYSQATLPRYEWQESVVESTSTKPYSFYRALSIENYEIRLLSILPDLDDSFSINCTVENASLIDYPEYKALSYCWGAADVTEIITVNGTGLQVTVNLAAALRQLRSQERGALWIDALCINQTDREERALQVQLMKSIFSQATEVIVWVGLEEEYSIRALDFMEFLGQIPLELEAAIQERELVAKSEEYHASWVACDLFFARPYWRRVWIIQEIAVATKIRVQCGQRIASWQNVIKGLSFTNHVDFERFRDSVKKRELGTLLQALYHTRSSLATDARDKIYALLGLSSDGSDIIRLPNYKQPIEIILKQMTKSIFLRDRCLDLMTLRRPDRIHRIGLPSWVPDWTALADAVRPWQVKHLKYSKRTIRSQADGYQQLSGTDVDHMHIHNYFGFRGDILWVTGQVLCTIDKLSGSLHGQALNSLSTEPQPKGSAYQHIDKPDLGDMVHFDVRRVGDQVGIDDRTRELQPNLEHWINTNQDFIANGRPLKAYFEPLLSSGDLDEPFEIKHNVDKKSPHLDADHPGLGINVSPTEQVLKWGIRLFVTPEGRFGLAHAQAQKGDKICHIRGCCMRIILRKCRDDWNVIGEAYLSQYLESDIADKDDQQFLLR